MQCLPISKLEEGSQRGNLQTSSPQEQTPSLQQNCTKLGLAGSKKSIIVYCDQVEFPLGIQGWFCIHIVTSLIENQIVIFIDVEMSFKEILKELEEKEVCDATRKGPLEWAPGSKQKAEYLTCVKHTGLA